MSKTRIAILTATLVGSLSLAACSQNDADVASKNISTDADNFKIERQIVFYNGITGEYVAEVDGFCSIGNNDDPGKLSVTCKVGEGKYIKNYLGLSDNVTWFALQTKSANVSANHYKVVFKPSTVVPNFEVR